MSDAKEFKNDHMTVAVVEEPGCLVKLDISLTPQASKAAYVKAIKSVNKEVTLPGFRKGRAPDDLVLTHYKKYVEDEWKDILLNTAFSESIDLVKLYPLNKNSMKPPHIKEISKETGSRFTIEFETTPKVPDLSPAEFKLTEIKPKEVTEKDVESFIEELRLRAATWETITDRGVQDGDYVDLDIDNLDEAGMKICENARFEVSDKMARWMHKLLIGLKEGDTAEGLSEKDQNEVHACTENCGTEGHHHHEDFKPTNCKIKVVSVKKPVLPAVDEEFVKKVSGESLEKFNEHIRQKLERDAENEKMDLLKDQIKKQIEDNYAFDIPKSFLTSSRPEELAQMRLFFAASEFAKKHQITVNNNEIYQAAMHEVVNQGEFAEDLIKGDEKKVDTIRSILYTNILIEKVLSKLLHMIDESKTA